MITLKNPAQVAKMRSAGHLLYDIMQRLREVIKAGETTAAIDAFADELIKRHHAIPSFYNYRGYPKSICTSIDDEVVHGIPSDQTVLTQGSIVSIDCGLILDGWQADSAFTVPIGKVSPAVLDTLESFAVGPDADVRILSAELLARFDPKRAAKLAEKMLEDALRPPRLQPTRDCEGRFCRERDQRRREPALATGRAAGVRGREGREHARGGGEGS